MRQTPTTTAFPRNHASGMHVKTLAASLGLVVAGSLAGTIQAETIQKDSTGTSLRSADSWVGESDPGSGDTGLFDELAGPGGPYSVPSGNPTWNSIRITNPSHDVVIDVGTTTWTINGSNAAMVDMSSATRDLTFTGDGTYLRHGSGAATWAIASERTVTFSAGLTSNNSNNRTHTITGGGTFVMNGTMTSGGSTRHGLNVTNGTLRGTGTIRPNNTNVGGGVRVQDGSRIAPGDDEDMETLTIDSDGTTETVLVMASGSDFGFQLGEGGSFAAPGTSDRLAIVNAVANDVQFNNNDIDFLGTGSVGIFKLFDGLEHADPAQDTWSGLTLGGESGREITGGLNVTNLAPDLSGTLYLGDGENFGEAGDIYIEVVP